MKGMPEAEMQNLLRQADPQEQVSTQLSEDTSKSGLDNFHSRIKSTVSLKSA